MDINRWYTGNNISYATLAAMAVCADATAVCTYDSDNFPRYAYSYYSRFSEFEYDVRVFQS